MESARSVIARDFLDCAERFTRIAARNMESAPRELQHAEAWAAKILKRAVDAGIVEVPEGFPWPETGAGARRPIDSEEFKWASSWTACMAVLNIDRSATDIPINLLAFQSVPGRSGVFVTSPGGTVMKAENFAVVCAWLSRLCAESADDAFVPAVMLWKQQPGMTAAKCNKLLERHPEIRRQKPNKKTLLIHSGDWLRHFDAADRQKSRLLDTDEVAAQIADFEARKAEVRRARYPR